MSGIAFSFDHDFTRGISIPADPRLNSGSLLLLEPARDGVAGVPVNLANYAADTASVLVGEDMASIPVIDTLTGVPGCLVERSARGGLHGIVTTAAMGEHGTRAALRCTAPDALRAYLLAHPGNSLYVSMVGRVTRNATTPAYNAVVLGGIVPRGDIVVTASAGWGVGIMQATSSGNVAGTPPPGIARHVNRSVSTVQPYFADAAVSGHGMTSDADFAAGRGDLFTMGERETSAVISGLPSHILYSLYVEDLTVSGRSYDECHEISAALFADRFKAGGHYDGDTWTSPASVT